MHTNGDGTIDVRVVLTVQVDPNAWAHGMMGEHPDEVLQKHVRADVKKRVRDMVGKWAAAQADYDEEMTVPIGTVVAQGIYP